MPTGRAELAATTGADGRIYAIGGRVYLPSSTCCALNTVEAYTARTDTWAQIAPMPTARYGLAAVTGPDGRIYAIGGEDDHGAILATVEAYTPSTNSWAAVAPMPTPRFGLAAATGSDGRIYAIGGDNLQRSRLTTVEAYTPGTNAWKTVAPMPTAREGLAAVTGPDGRIYGIGGDENTYLNTVEAYAPPMNSWAPVAPMPTARTGLAAAIDPSGRLYVLGGIDARLGSAAVESYATASDTWHRLAAMPTPRAGLAAATGSDGRIYAIGGAVVGSVGVTNVVEAFTAPSSLPGPTCQFVLGFGALHGRIPAIVGACLDDEQHNPANGDGLQHTTNGLLVWRKADNFTAFTDGYRTWVHGSYGIQERLNTQRFPWEANPDALPTVP